MLVHQCMQQEELADVIAGPFSTIYRSSWEPREVPAVWKLANVTPIYRKGTREDPGSCRPISLSSVHGKVAETIDLGDNEKHLKNKAIISRS